MPHDQGHGQRRGGGQGRGDRVDLNRASREELLGVNGIGESGADAILKYREENGPFRSLEDLDPIPGFNRERIENFQDRFTL
jgi:competence protein ComEA